MKKILVAGSKGFIGSALKKKLEDLNFQITEFKGDVSVSQSYKDIVNKTFSHCFHLAAKTFVPDSWSNSAEFIKTNVIGTERILNYCSGKKISLTYLSAYLYGIPERLPISETHPLKPNNPYALSKYLAENLCRYYSVKHKLKVTVFRPFNVYGPNQDKKFLIPSVIEQVLNSKNTISVKDIAPKRDYIYIDDLIEAMILSMNNNKRYAVYNIASGTSISVKKVIDVIQKAAKTNKKIKSEGINRTNEIPDTIANINLAKQELQWNPKYTFEKGILEVLQT